MTTLTRRATLIAAATGLATPALISGASAQTAPTETLPRVPYRRLKLGDFTLTTLLAGTRPMTEPQTIFGLNATAEEFAALSAEAFIPADASLNGFTPTLVETGSEVVLFDTGLAPEGITAALTAAGVAPEAVTLVVLTHMHGDHIGGLSDGTTPTFPNARYATGKVEYDYWAGAGNTGFDAKVRPLADQMTFLADGDSPAEGLTAIFAPGHTPGHMAFRIDSAGQNLILTADTANHYVWSLERPDWEVKYDMDATQAAATRHKLLGMIAAERLPFIGYHMPFPGVGFLEAKGEGFHFVPASYQFDL
ncbi:glyoxylase-like metal-dependent hydrolase (beta-lactamase superfamily II) [Rhodobacter sp. JA431]|uniref:MBL fold metallo-hydrolase n=1 Tax=Rhodobacter sp. JA431 TaxID=570013 RepID=UPI000BD6D0B5|nr:MBL fold metallo-hydrolase [Rhodobacter sp. JA431]SOB89608.1 glyoxylase-like metal-dependent hydrolase (beta-lactamase superfamily II) [Rhodobacter sp. JA431]